MPPIGTPSSLFQSVIGSEICERDRSRSPSHPIPCPRQVLGSEDRERLRALIAALGKDLRECLSRCELRVRGQLGATSAAGFGEATLLEGRSCCS